MTDETPDFPPSTNKVNQSKVLGDQIDLYYGEKVSGLGEDLPNPNDKIWGSQLATNMRIQNSRIGMYNVDQIYKTNELHILSYSHQYDIIAKKIQIYMSMDKHYKGKKAFAKIMAEICNDNSALMEKVWNALEDQADKDERTDDLLRFLKKLEGIKLIGPNYESLIHYAKLMQYNLHLDAVNSLYDVTGKITDITHDKSQTPQKTVIKYTNYKTLEENEIINADEIILETSDPTDSYIGKLISFDIDDDNNEYIDRDSNDDLVYEVKEDTSERELELWNALAADTEYDPLLIDMDDYTTDAKRNYEYEKDLNEAQIYNFRFRNMTALGQYHLTIAKYADMLAKESQEDSEEYKMWKKAKTDAYLMYKRTKKMVAQNEKK